MVIVIGTNGGTRWGEWSGFHLHSILIHCQAQFVHFFQHLQVIAVVLDDLLDGVDTLRQQQALGADSVRRMRGELPRFDFLPRRKSAQADKQASRAHTQ